MFKKYGLYHRFVNYFFLRCLSKNMGRARLFRQNMQIFKHFILEIDQILFGKFFK